MYHKILNRPYYKYNFNPGIYECELKQSIYQHVAMFIVINNYNRHFHNGTINLF